MTIFVKYVKNEIIRMFLNDETDEMKKRVTIKDVADRAGVTVGTVSHVLNGTASISAETMGRVQEAIKELSYIPNIAARSIRAKHSKYIGLLVPKLSNFFYSEIAAVFMEEAEKEGYMVSLLSFEYQIDRERSEVRAMMQNNANLIVLINGYDDEAILQEALKGDMKLILVDRRSPFPEIPYIEYENCAAIDQAVRFLYEKGYRSLGYITEPANMINLQDRLTAFQEAAVKYGFSQEAVHIYVSDSFRNGHTEYGYKFMKKLLETQKKAKLPEVFLCSSDMLAFGVMKAMIDGGYRIPEEFALVGFDDLEMAAYMNPALTTIRQDRKVLGQRLWQMAYECMNGLPVKNLRLAQQLVLRNSA